MQNISGFPITISAPGMGKYARELAKLRDSTDTSSMSENNLFAAVRPAKQQNELFEGWILPNEGPSSQEDTTNTAIEKGKRLEKQTGWKIYKPFGDQVSNTNTNSQSGVINTQISSNPVAASKYTFLPPPSTSNAPPPIQPGNRPNSARVGSFAGFSTKLQPNASAPQVSTNQN
ncbi:MAG: hypothetical protein EZS28_008544 [Streblomastix strix]|uniref:Uncharacterized protein n=1 Tax=Streblomastix strix TaxID=222440 RepID=A0A5J4WP00_9EUKA|nr:MAG: hypothetical protein EZS28_008544 [Streblomastix strix]